MHLLLVVVVRQNKYVAFYAQLLPDKEQVEEYATFLRGIEKIEDRRVYLEQAKDFFPRNVLAITKLLVQSILSTAVSLSPSALARVA